MDRVKKRKRLAVLAEAAGTDTVVRLGRAPLDEHGLDGFVVGLGERLVLLHVVDGNTAAPNGYAAVRLKDVKRAGRDETFVCRALRLLGHAPVVPLDADLSSGWPALLAWADAHYPLVMLECEQREPGCAFIGRVRDVDARRVRLDKTDARALPSGTEDFRLRDVTKVGFGDGYTLALAALVARDRAGGGREREG